MPHHHRVGIVMDGVLERCEIGKTGFIGNDSLAVDVRILDIKLSRRFDQPCKFACPVRTGFGEDANILGAVDDDLGAVAVELDLVNPVVTLRWLSDQLGDHGRNKRQPFGPTNPNARDPIQ
jgi:hypothetical protein